MIYLDNAATTKVAPEVLEAMMPYLTDEYGNAGSTYKFGRNAMAAIQKARAQVANLFNCSSDNVIFTSGGSESNNMVFQGLRHKLMEAGKKHLVVSAIEHDSVLKAAEMLTKDGFYITYVAPDKDGYIRPRVVSEAITEETGLVSVMYVNNEIGTVNDIKELGTICRQKNVLFHTDCVQAAGQYAIDVNECCIDFASISSHKIHGAKGIGALYVRNPDIQPLICGGSEQEHGLRGGTENVSGIVGFGKAAELTLEHLCVDMIEASVLKQQFYMRLHDTFKEAGGDIDTIHVNGHPIVEPGKILNIRIDGVDAETLLLMLDARDICISAGSACRSHEANPSHVLKAMGLTDDESRSSIRISFSRYNTEDEVFEAAEKIALCARALQEELQNI